MKMSLSDLQVESYATQLSETELTEVKGGSSLPCAAAAGIYALGTAVVTGTVAIIGGLIIADNDHEECGSETVTKTDECGNTTTTVTHLCRE